MEDSKADKRLKGILTKKEVIKKANTYQHSQVNGLIEKGIKKKVGFADRGKSGPLLTFFHYDQVELEEEVIVKTNKTCSCACDIF